MNDAERTRERAPMISLAALALSVAAVAMASRIDRTPKAAPLAVEDAWSSEVELQCGAEARFHDLRLRLERVIGNDPENAIDDVVEIVLSAGGSEERFALIEKEKIEFQKYSVTLRSAWPTGAPLEGSALFSIGRIASRRLVVALARGERREVAGMTFHLGDFDVGDPADRTDDAVEVHVAHPDLAFTIWLKEASPISLYMSSSGNSRLVSFVTRAVTPTLEDGLESGDLTPNGEAMFEVIEIMGRGPVTTPSPGRPIG
jgi:hypothetical protein